MVTIPIPKGLLGLGIIILVILALLSVPPKPVNDVAFEGVIDENAIECDANPYVTDEPTYYDHKIEMFGSDGKKMADAFFIEKNHNLFDVFIKGASKGLTMVKVANYLSDGDITVDEVLMIALFLEAPGSVFALRYITLSYLGSNMIFTDLPADGYELPKEISLKTSWYDYLGNFTEEVINWVQGQAKNIFKASPWDHFISQENIMKEELLNA